jgi:hypothetical protein
MRLSTDDELFGPGQSRSFLLGAFAGNLQGNDGSIPSLSGLQTQKALAPGASSFMVVRATAKGGPQRPLVLVDESQG